ncbi:hypothetical protein LK09_01820 [Microbacterium mangrovi]|uniref:Uncharacterized protein n=1 Tax=Microbacterium mangrovi TaxID=1348253 RepID=A0A0B2A8I9_9MICO|nr:hypothetical protein [Microbacterium mangrovi]KHK99425.1 hypothetical protein LK09_01820 [Microbacterium mangrovi]
MSGEAGWLKRFFSDPMADAVKGTAEILAVSEPVGRGPFSKCMLDVIAAAPDIEPRTVTVEAVLRIKHWPRVGMVVPARLPPARPDLVALDLEAFTR